MTEQVDMSITTPDGNTVAFNSETLKKALDAGFARERRRHKPDADFDAAADEVYCIAAGELRQFVERVEHLEAEKAEIADQVKEVFAEAKGRGYDTKALRAIIRLRKMDRDKLAEFEAVVDMYRAALGM